MIIIYIIPAFAYDLFHFIIKTKYQTITREYVRNRRAFKAFNKRWIYKNEGEREADRTALGHSNAGDECGLRTWRRSRSIDSTLHCACFSYVRFRFVIYIYKYTASIWQEASFTLISTQISHFPVEKALIWCLIFFFSSGCFLH